MFGVMLVALGGMIGTLARYSAGVMCRGVYERTGFPWATIAVNLIGCFAIGLVHGMLADRWTMRDEHRIALIVGVLGGFTTFSSFGWDTTQMLRDGQLLRAATNVMVQNVLGIGLVFAGYAIAHPRAG